MKYSHIQHLAFLSFLILFSACAPKQTQVPPTQTNRVLADATNTPNLANTPTSAAKLSCPRINPSIQFNLPKDSSKLETALLNYLDEGGNPVKIESMVGAPEVQPFFTLSADIDGDLLPEFVAITRDLFENPATIRIFHCDQNDYALEKSFSPDGISFGIPEFATKIFDSKPPFIIVRAGRISGWAQDFLAIGWHNSEWQIINLATGTTPSEIALFDQNADGTKEVVIKTKTASTPGGGLSRVIVDSYTWNGKEFVFTSNAMPPGNNRVNYLDDAETAWKNGNPLLAISYYEIAARDVNLSSYWTSYELEHKQTELAKPYQQAFAFFRIIATWFYLERPDVASQYIQEMSEAFPKGKPGNEFVQAAQAFSDWYDKDPDFSKSCAQAVSLLDTKYPNIVSSHLGDWGVANPIYLSTSDICAFK